MRIAKDYLLTMFKSTLVVIASCMLLASCSKDKGPEIADVPKIVDGRAAAVHASVLSSGIQWNKVLDRTRQRIEQF